MAGSDRSRSRSNLTRLVQTHISRDAGAQLTAKAEGAGIKEAAYVRLLILRDLGLTDKDNKK